jgi:hypothetical protein
MIKCENNAYPKICDIQQSVKKLIKKIVIQGKERGGEKGRLSRTEGRRL